ncbi:hypothetical protein [Algibacter sp. L3A6]|uniref:hypothetical protein n=1 Tax=Algibacter sp. L3A6 TaxID=2686366 RepID=UPI00131BEB16|nr:hypothetical protein [Algibacter sp. L3A6]
MKKTILNVFAVLFISSLAFANSSEVDKKTNRVTSDDDVWICYTSNVTEEEDIMTGEVVVTKTTKCIWFNM